MLSPRGYSPLYALEIASHRVLRYATPFLHLIALVTNVAAARRGLGVHGDPRAAGGAPASPRRSAVRAGAPVPGGALLRARHGLARRRPVRLAAHRHAGRAGRRRRARGEPRCSTCFIAALALVGELAACCVGAIVAIRLESHGLADLPPARVGKDGEPFEMLKLRTMVSGAETMGAGMAVNYGDPRITRVGALPAPLLARRAAQPRERAARRDVDRRPAPDHPGAGRPVHRAPAPPARGEARHHRLGAGERPRVAAVARAHRARRLVRRQPLAARSTCGSSRARRGCS